MNFLEIMSPLIRHKKMLLALIVCFSALFFGIGQLVPETHKITVYFTIKTLGTEQGMSLDTIESSSKIAESIAGWAKNPAFRNEILKNSNIYIDNFKRKITAREQNRNNVFWTIKLSNEEVKHSDLLVKSLYETLTKKIRELSENSSFPFTISSPEVAVELSGIPTLWLVLASIFLGMFLGTLFIFLLESLTGKVSFLLQIKEIFPDSPLLRISEQIGNHDKKILEKYILTFENPRLFPGFINAEEYFAFSDIDDFDFETETPVLITKLGVSTLRELENFKAVFGESVGIVVFEK